MAWPANQTQPHLSAAISWWPNKILRFANEIADIPLTIRAHGSLSASCVLDFTPTLHGARGLTDRHKADGFYSLRIRSMAIDLSL